MIGRTEDGGVGMDRPDVVVVGGGIGGAALAYALADEGLDVTVLEATAEYEDRVRGESMQPWGVKEAQELGLEQVLTGAGAHITPVWKQYVQGVGQTNEIPVSMLIPGVGGSLNLGHPVACQALVDAAAAAGATVVRNVRDVKLSGGGPVAVSYRAGQDHREVTASLVVGADGRGSTVRRQVGIDLERQEPSSFIAGLLVDGLDDVPAEHDVMASEGDRLFVLFHQTGGRARAYLATGERERRRFAGRDATQRFLEACRIDCFPWSGSIASSTPAGPCAAYPGDDTWTATPFADGVVLVGDAAGHNDPIIGQGLSIALRDARIVRDLVLDGARTADAFRPYGEERMDRMRRVRLIADVVAAVNVEDADNRAARLAWFGERMATMDPDVFPLLVAAFAGPETVPVELVDERLLERIRTA
jgi:2-polyprenyl-6-methoxyphenol hydroxylase-like FAD-dependent oxidoreductase